MTLLLHQSILVEIGELASWIGEQHLNRRPWFSRFPHRKRCPVFHSTNDNSERGIAVLIELTRFQSTSVSARKSIHVSLQLNVAPDSYK
jgi:hypothetical protein